MQISVIIPVYNEASFIRETLEIIRNQAQNYVSEIIVVDGGSSDGTQKRVRQSRATLILCPERGRAAQMNFAASRAKGDILYFLHADTHPPKSFDALIHQAVCAGYDAGCFQLSFDKKQLGLQFYSLFTRLNWNIFRFGDQSLFVKRSVFNKKEGFKNEYLLMEDQELVQRISCTHPFKLLDESVTTSARKYIRNGVVRLQLVYVLIFCLYYLGVSQAKLYAVYSKLVE